MSNLAQDLMDHPSVADRKAQVERLSKENNVEEAQVYSFPDGSRLEIRARPGEDATVETFASPTAAPPT